MASALDELQVPLYMPRMPPGQALGTRGEHCQRCSTPTSKSQITIELVSDKYFSFCGGGEHFAAHGPLFRDCERQLRVLFASSCYCRGGNGGRIPEFAFDFAGAFIAKPYARYLVLHKLGRCDTSGFG
jgi:hypothetical protein